MLAELDNCGARRCGHVADSLAQELDQKETYKPVLVAEKIPHFLQPDPVPYGQQGLVPTKVHDITKLRYLLKNREVQEESVHSENDPLKTATHTSEADDDALLGGGASETSLEKYKEVERNALAPV